MGTLVLITGAVILSSYLLKGKAVANIANRVLFEISGVKIEGFGFSGLKLALQYEVSNPTEDKAVIDLMYLDFGMKLPNYQRVAKLRYDKNSTPKLPEIQPRSQTNLSININVPLLSLGSTLIAIIKEAVKKGAKIQDLKNNLPKTIIINGEVKVNGISIPVNQYEYSLN